MKKPKNKKSGKEVFVYIGDKIVGVASECTIPVNSNQYKDYESKAPLNNWDTMVDGQIFLKQGNEYASFQSDDITEETARILIELAEESIRKNDFIPITVGDPARQAKLKATRSVGGYEFEIIS